MPTYEFLCERCHKMFDVVWSLAEFDKRSKEKHKCPACGSTQSGQNSVCGSSKNIKKELKTPRWRLIFEPRR